MAAWAIGQTDRFKAALMAAGISDWGMLVATGEGGTLEAGLGGSCGWEGHRPAPPRPAQPDLVRLEDPHPGADRARRGRHERAAQPGDLLPPRAAVMYGAEHELVVYPREGHGFRERNHQLDLLRRTRAWFDRWLRDEASDGRGSPA